MSAVGWYSTQRGSLRYSWHFHAKSTKFRVSGSSPQLRNLAPKLRAPFHTSGAPSFPLVPRGQLSLKVKMTLIKAISLLGG